jgi:hypothetical protein
MNKKEDMNMKADKVNYVLGALNKAQSFGIWLERLDFVSLEF